MKIILKYIKPFWLYVIGIFVLLGMRSISELYLPYLMSDIVDIGIVNGNIRYIINVGLLMLGVTIIGMGSNLLVVFVASLVSLRICTGLREKIFDKILSFSSKEVDEFGVSSLITRSTNDIMQIQNFIIMFLRIGLYSPVMAIGGIFMVLRSSQNMTYVIVIAVLSLISLVCFMSFLIVPKFKVLQNFVDEVNKVSREMLTGLLVVRAFGKESHMEKRFDETNVKLTKVSMFINRAASFMFPLMGLIMNFTIVAILWVGANQIDRGFINIGDMMAFIQYAMLIIMSFLLFSMMFIMMPRAMVSAKRINDVLECKLSIIPSNLEEFKNNSGTVEFKDVSFKYPNADEEILKNISFVAESGKVTAFIGSTGSGKSTAVSLIPRFYDVTKGEILVNGVNIKNVNQKLLNRKIGFVPQKGILFGGTIKSNIKFGDYDNISDEAMEKAADIAQAKDFIEKKELKYDEPISQGGTNVSGGQRQRLSIARAIAINPEILIFDDSFSALDYKTDRQLRKRLTEELRGKTIIIVAQRINTIKNADKIIVMDNGEVVGVGKHEELLDSCHIYKEIASSQLTKEEM